MGMIYAPPSIIPNGALINNVCHIYQTTKPTTRPDGSALVVRDKWYNTDTGVEGFWNGTYWLKQAKGIQGAYTFLGSSSFVNQPAAFVGDSAFGAYIIKELQVAYRSSSVLFDSSNFYSLLFNFRGGRNQIGNGFPNIEINSALNGINNPFPTTTENVIIFPFNAVLTWRDIFPLTATVNKTGTAALQIDVSYSLIIHSIL